MVKMMILTIAIAACAVDPQPTATPSERTLWRCWTHATCDGVRLDQPHDLCVEPSRVDLESAPGELAAEDFRGFWVASCAVEQGQVLNTAAPRTCVHYETGEQSPWGCDAACVPLYRGCE